MNGIHRLPHLGWVVLSWALASGCATGSASLEPVRGEAVEVMLPPPAEELSHFVLVLQEGADGRMTHAWRRAELFDLSAYKRSSRTRGMEGEVVFASMRPRDCHAEHLECVDKCMARPLAPGYGHVTRGRGKGAKEEFCRGECLRPYMDCEEAQGRQTHEFSATDKAVGWLTDNRQALLAGSVVVIAGVVFVTVSGGAGLFVLVPAVLLSDAGLGVEPHALVAIQ
jgi:hypothetical protein